MKDHYRLIERPDGMFVVQEKCFFWWVSLEDYESESVARYKYNKYVEMRNKKIVVLASTEDA